MCLHPPDVNLTAVNTPYPASQTSSLGFIVIVNCLMRIIIATLTIYTSREHNHGYILQYGYMLECSEVNKKIILHLPPSRTVRLVAGLEIWAGDRCLIWSSTEVIVSVAHTETVRPTLMSR